MMMMMMMMTMMMIMMMKRNSNGYTYVFGSARLNCSTAVSCFQLQIQDGGRKKETRTIFDTLSSYQPAVICQL